MSKTAGFWINTALSALLSAAVWLAVLPPDAMAGEFRFAPASGRLSSQFGWRSDPMHGGSRFHSGIDIAANQGSPVYAPQAGVVMFSGPYKGYGNVVVLHHGQGLYTLYGHNSRLLVQQGDIINFGQVIAQVGSTGRSTGPHLHFEVHYNKQYVNPLKYLAMLERNQAMQISLGTLSPQPVAAPRAVAHRAIARKSSGKTVQLVQGSDVTTHRF